MTHLQPVDGVGPPVVCWDPQAGERRGLAGGQLAGGLVEKHPGHEVVEPRLKRECGVAELEGGAVRAWRAGVGPPRERWGWARRRRRGARAWGWSRWARRARWRVRVAMAARCGGASAALRCAAGSCAGGCGVPHGGGAQRHQQRDGWVGAAHRGQKMSTRMRPATPPPRKSVQHGIFFANGGHRPQ